MPDLPDVAHLLERAERILHRHLGIHGVQLVEIDPLQPQPLQAPVNTLLQILRPPVRHPLPGAWPGKPALGRDDDSFRVRMQRFSDQELARLRPVGIGGIDQVHVQLDRAFENSACLIPIFRPTPDPVASDPHRAKPKPINRKIAADFEHRITLRVRCHCRLKNR